MSLGNGPHEIVIFCSYLKHELREYMRILRFFKLIQKNQLRRIENPVVDSYIKSDVTSSFLSGYDFVWCFSYASPCNKVPS